MWYKAGAAGGGPAVPPEANHLEKQMKTGAARPFLGLALVTVALTGLA
jgi:hypothetical protein